MRLTWEILIKLGFHGEGKDLTNKPCYRLRVPYRSLDFKFGYHYQFQMVLNEEFPDSNPNSGILSLYSPAMKDCHMICSDSDKTKVDFVMWDTKDRGDGKPEKGGIKYIDEKERNLYIAWHVTTLERLNEIYCALTRNEPLKIRNPKPLSKAAQKRFSKFVQKIKPSNECQPKPK